MPRIPGLRRVFRLATRRASIDDDIDAELTHHFDRTIADLVARGMTPEAARADAQRRFGDVHATRQRLRTIDGRRDRTRRVGEWMEGLAQDLRIAARALRRAPGFASVIVLTLALGVGANAMMFGIVDRLLLRPPAYLHDADRTGRVFVTRARDGGEDTMDRIGYAHLRDLREGTAGLMDLVGVTTSETVVGDGAAARVEQVGLASGELWQLFDARPMLGRFFGPSDDRLPAGSPVAVLGVDYWHRELGSDPAVIGRPLRIGGAVYTIIGIAPHDFTGVGLNRVDAWVPLTAGSASDITRDFATNYGFAWFQLIAHRRPGVSIDVANAALSRALVTSFERRAATQPNVSATQLRMLRRSHAAIYPVLFDRGPTQGDGARVALWVLGVAAIVLLVACANVANLLLARALVREREIALRVALGVGRARLMRQLLAEVGLLAALGAVTGLLIARVGSAVVMHVLLPEIAWGESLTDGRTLLATGAIALIAGTLASLAPSVRALRPDVVSRLRGGAREGGARHQRTRAALVLAQSTLSVILLVGAGLFVRSLRNVRALDYGFEPTGATYVSVDLRGGTLDRVAQRALYARLADRVREMPGVEAVGTTFELPYYMGSTVDHLRLPGRDSIAMGVHQNTVSGAYFPAMGTRVLAGRVWDPRGAGAEANAIVVSERLAHQLWPGQNAVGRCAIVDEAAGSPCRPVIGVVQDVRQSDPREPGVSGFYVTMTDPPTEHEVSGLVVRTRTAAAAHVLVMQRALQPLVPGAAYVGVHALADIVIPEQRPWQLGATLFAAFGALGLLVAAVGLYSALAYDVAQRRHDFGIRVALGARSSDVLRLVVRRGLAIAVTGITVGLALSLVAGRFIEALLVGVSPHDPVTLGGVAAVLLVAAVAASLVPGRRAASVDPAVTLRSE